MIQNRVLPAVVVSVAAVENVLGDVLCSIVGNIRKWKVTGLYMYTFCCVCMFVCMYIRLKLACDNTFRCFSKFGCNWVPYRARTPHTFFPIHLPFTASWDTVRD